MLTVPKLAHQPQLRKATTMPPSLNDSMPSSYFTPLNILRDNEMPKLQILSPNLIRGKQNLPLRKNDLQSIPSLASTNELSARSKHQPVQKIINQKILPSNNQKWIQNKTPSKAKKIDKGTNEFFSPNYTKEREQNQRILQSLKLQNENYKKLIQENQFLRNRQKINEVTPFDFSSQSQRFCSLVPNMKKTPKKQVFDHPRKALEQMTNLASSFIFDENETSASSFNSFEFSGLNSKESTFPSKHHAYDFEKIKFLGKGNFGEVNLVRHKKTNFICAMKTIKKSFAKEENVMHQISRQIRIHFSLKHLNIIAFYGFFDDHENVYFLIQYATGGQLYKRLKECYRMPENQVVPIIRNALDGLKMIHSLGYIHRDLKPENMIFQFGIGKICDLGWAADCGFNEMRKSYCGTPLYLPPQMIRKELYDQSADIWSIGILTYELLVGKIPFNIWSEYDLQQIVDKEINFPTNYVDMSPDSIDFIRKCLNKDPLKRIKLQQLINHPFLKISQNEGYFNVQVYDWVERLFE